jgi:hypothetical protein
VVCDDGPGEKDAVIVAGNYQDAFRNVDRRWYFTEVTARIYQIFNLEEGWGYLPFRCGYASLGCCATPRCLGACVFWGVLLS